MTELGIEATVPEINPKLCSLCQKDPHKYRCPKCEIRTCSLQCSKQHKIAANCDGVRGMFQPVKKLSQFDEKKSIEDQLFLHSVHEVLYNQDSHKSVQQNGHTDHHVINNKEQITLEENHNIPNQDEDGCDGLRHKAKSSQERFLIQNALKRRIWLTFSNDKGGEDCSRHEQFSDTIFWCLDMIFTKDNGNGNKSEYSCRIQNIPESIRIITVLRQFLKPRKYGCIISESDLDIEKMTPFIEAGVENLNLFMKVPNFDKQRYYTINVEKNILDNMRNRLIVDHPKLIITLNNECMDFEVISESEAEEIRERNRKERSERDRYEKQQSRGLSMRGSRGGNGMDTYTGIRGRGRGFNSGLGGSHFESGMGRRGRGRFAGGNAKRQSSWNTHQENDYGWKKGRFNRSVNDGVCRKDNYRRWDDPDAFDPFEPFEGPNALPLDYSDQAIESWGNCIKKKGDELDRTLPPIQESVSQLNKPSRVEICEQTQRTIEFEV